MRYRLVAEKITEYNKLYSIPKSTLMSLALSGVTFLVNFKEHCPCGGCGFVSCHSLSNKDDDFYAPEEIFTPAQEEKGYRL